MVEQYNRETCKCCGGQGVQTLNTGERIPCNGCGGRGFVFRSNYDNLPPGVYCCTGNARNAVEMR